MVTFLLPFFFFSCEERLDLHSLSYSDAVDNSDVDDCCAASQETRSKGGSCSGFAL